MLIRFTVLTTDPDSGRASGVLVAAHDLRDGGDLSVADHSELRRALLWFNEHICVPSILADPTHKRAISWFKPAADEAIRQMWQLKRLLEQHGHHINVLRTNDPGTVIYQDDWQVVAKPRKGQNFR